MLPLHGHEHSAGATAIGISTVNEHEHTAGAAAIGISTAGAAAMGMSTLLVLLQ